MLGHDGTTPERLTEVDLSMLYVHGIDRTRQDESGAALAERHIFTCRLAANRDANFICARLSGYC